MIAYSQVTYLVYQNNMVNHLPIAALRLLTFLSFTPYCSPTDNHQNSSTLRRLASDHASLHTSELPPHYLFPPSSAASSMPDDLTQLTILLTGPQGTPYSKGLWKLHLKIPEDYPKSPPKAAFRTRIWHPNVEESSGSICVDTLKRDWDTKLTLRDVLIVRKQCVLHENQADFSRQYPAS